jgi:hypothetical protein
MIYPSFSWLADAVQGIPQEQFGLASSTSDGENKLYASDGLVGRAVGDVPPPMPKAGVYGMPPLSSWIYSTRLLHVARSWVPGHGRVYKRHRNRDIYLQRPFIASDESIFFGSLHARKRRFSFIIVINSYCICGGWL